jgi:hypothetical protein
MHGGSVSVHCAAQLPRREGTVLAPEPGQSYFQVSLIVTLPVAGVV